jgi:hypothetical protein
VHGGLLSCGGSWGLWGLLGAAGQPWPSWHGAQRHLPTHLPSPSLAHISAGHGGGVRRCCGCPPFRPPKQPPSLLLVLQVTAVLPEGLVVTPHELAAMTAQRVGKEGRDDGEEGGEGWAGAARGSRPEGTQTRARTCGPSFPA